MIASRAMRKPFLALALGLLSTPAAAQSDIIFGTGAPPPVFREELLDKRFKESKVHRLLNQGTDDPNCAQLVGALLTLVGETAPQIHKRDENFYLDPMLVQAMNTQLSHARFPANIYFVSMMRRMFIDKKLSEEWLKTATDLAPYYPALDLAKLRFLSEGLNPVDSFLLTLPLLHQRYQEEVGRANTTAADTAESLFRDNYLDHEVAFGGLEFVDAKLVKPPKKRKKRKNEDVEQEAPYIQARLVWYLAEQETSFIEMLKAPKKKRPAIQVTARLQEKQYVELGRILKGSRLLVRGRLWDFKKGVTEVELRDALLFQDPDWSRGAVLGNPNVIATCPAAINELTGTAPQQIGGFGTHR